MTIKMNVPEPIVKATLFSALVFSLCTGPAGAQTPAKSAAAVAYPERAVRLIVPFGAGGSADNFARILAQRLGDAWAQQVVVDDRPGSAGVIGTEIAAKATPDGYTWVIGNIGNIAINPALYTKLPYHPRADFAPVSLMASSAYVVIVPLSLPATTMEQFVAMAKAKPGQFNYASTGNGSVSQLGAEMLASMIGTRFSHVPYKSHGTMMVDLATGRVHLMFDGMASAQAQVRAGKLRALAVSTAKRSPVMAEVPTVAESGVPGFEVSGWYGVLVPKGTPPRIVEKLHGDIAVALKSPDLRERFAADGAEAVSSTPAEFSIFIGRELEKWAKVVKVTGVATN